MPEFLRLIPPDEARSLLLSHLSGPFDPIQGEPQKGSEIIDSALSIGRITAEDIVAPHALPEFSRSTVDGYAVRAGDTFGATDSLPAYLNLIGEVPMGKPSPFDLKGSQCGLIHTGGMLPNGADSVVMLEYSQQVIGVSKKSESRTNEIEITKAVAEGENVILEGEDVAKGSVVLRRGRKLRPAEIGGLMALGITSVRVARRIKVGLISSGDEIVPPVETPVKGQVRDVNAYTLASLVTKSGGEPVSYGIVPDQIALLKDTAEKALAECDIVVITAGSSASTRDMTAEVIGSLGGPGVLVHGINTRPGKPTILGVCSGKAVVGLPGNPVSALVNGYLFVVPVIEKLLGLPSGDLFDIAFHESVAARLTVNLPSQAGREDWWPVRLIPMRVSAQQPLRENPGSGSSDLWQAEPIFGKSNLIFTLVAADGLLRIPPDVTGLSAGDRVQVVLF
jgi:molybdopterin molybdotransferase